MSYSVIIATGLGPVVLADGPANPFAAIGLTDSQPGWDHTFEITVSCGYISSSPAVVNGGRYPDGLELLSTTPESTDPTKPDTYLLYGKTADLQLYLSTRFQITPDPGAGSVTVLLSTKFGSFQPVNFGGTGKVSSANALESTVACFVPGTRIATPSGEIPIEHLRVGDLVVQSAGAPAPIRWIGRRAYANPPAAVQPVCLRAGAVWPDVPARDLLVSPQHALLFDGVLVPASLLVNGKSIVRFARFGSVDYLHIELDGHGIVFANGMPAETYVDCGNRGMFDNAATAPQGLPSWRFCAPRVTSGPELAAIRTRLAERAERLVGMSDAEEELFVLADGHAVLPDAATAPLLVFHMPDSPRDLRLLCRRAGADSPAQSSDQEQSGAALRRFVLRSAGASITVAAAEPILCDGFEPVEDGRRRWTTGHAAVPAALLESLTGPIVLEIEAEGLASSPSEVATQAAR